MRSSISEPVCTRRPTVPFFPNRKLLFQVQKHKFTVISIHTKINLYRADQKRSTEHNFQTKITLISGVFIV
jgi:hypothetical protein